MGDSSSSSSSWYRVSVKLRFFSRIRQFVLKTSVNTRPSCDERTVDLIIHQGKRSEGINHVDDKDDNGILQRSVKRLHFGSQEEKAAAAKEIKRLAVDDLRWRKMMADLGVIQPLVAMVGLEYTVAHRTLAVQTLLELANGTCT